MQSYGKVARVVSSAGFCFRNFEEEAGRAQKNAVILDWKYARCNVFGFFSFVLRLRFLSKRDVNALFRHSRLTFCHLKKCAAV